MLIEKIKRAFLPYKTFICSFSLKAACALILLYIFGICIEQIPPVVLALIWAVVSALFSITLAYPFIIRKINTKGMFQDGSEVSKRINGRVGRLIFCFVVSAILVASLLIESLKWNVLDWVLACCSIPLYFSLAILIHNNIIKKRIQASLSTQRTNAFHLVRYGCCSHNSVCCYFYHHSKQYLFFWRGLFLYEAALY